MDNIDTEFNSSFTIANVLDEIDWVVGGYIKPSAHFLQTFNIFVEGFVLSDNIVIPMHDFQHINLSIPFFANGRPILDMLIQANNLEAIVEGPEHLMDSIGQVIYTFTLKENETLNSNDEWFNNYKANVDKSNFSKLTMSFKDNQIPTSTPLLFIGGNNRDEAVIIMERDIDKCLQSVISTTLGTRLNPLLPCFASKMQIEFYNKNRVSYGLYKLITESHQVNTEEVIKHMGYQQLPTPPLLSILFSRCNTLKDIPKQLLELKAEFSSLRDATTLHIQRLENSQSLKEQIKIIDEYNEFCRVYTEKYNTRSTRIFYRFFDCTGDGNIKSIANKSAQAIYKMIEERKILNRFKGLTNLWNIYDDAPSIQKQILNANRLFGDCISQSEWNIFSRSASEIYKSIN